MSQDNPDQIYEGYNDVETLEGLLHVRIRPGMYVGDVHSDNFDSASTNMLAEIVGNSTDEVKAGVCNQIRISYDTKTKVVTVEDNGRGIPLGVNEEKGHSYLYGASMILNTGAKYRKTEEKTPFKFSIGMNGVGLKAVVATSSLAEIVSCRGSEVRYLRTEDSLLTKEVFCDLSKDPSQVPSDMIPWDGHGVKVRWTVDPSIIVHPLNVNHLHRYARERSYLFPKVSFLVNVDGKETEYRTEHGVPEYMEYLTKGKKPMFSFFPIEHTDENGHYLYTTQIAVMNGGGESIYPYINGNLIETSSPAVTELRKSFSKALLKYIELVYSSQLPAQFKGVEVRSEDVRSGMVAVLSMWHIDPIFDSQTKTKMTNTDIASSIGQVMPDKILAELANPDNRQAVNAMVEQAFLQAKARIAALEARRKALEGGKKSPKVEKENFVSLDIYTPPLVPNPKTNVLHLAEGESAAGSILYAVKRRNPETGRLYKDDCGILALKGITLNALEVGIERVLQNKEYSTLINVAGLSPNDPDNLSSMKFHKYIITSDADGGGAHITSLITAFFASKFPEVIKGGHLLRVIPPLFAIIDKKSNERTYVYPGENQREVIQSLGYSLDGAGREYTLKRFKGLGQMDDEAKKTLVGPTARYQTIQTDDIDKLLHSLELFHGKDRVADRRSLIFSCGLKEEEGLL